MRNMSFALTSSQILNQSKTVTRRVGWKALKIGDLVQPVLKSQGLKKGEGVVKLGCPIVIVKLTREKLMTLDASDLKKEGFGSGTHITTPASFVEFFCRTHKPTTPEDFVTRIEFEYTRPNFRAKSE